MSVNQVKDDSVTILEPDQILRDLIGQDTKLSEIFTKERIEECQGTINEARGSFFDVAQEELGKLEALIKSENADGKTNEATFDNIATGAANLRGHAEMFGFTLIGTISSHVIEQCEPGKHTPAIRFQLANDLVKFLRIAIRQKISDDRGMLARELNAALKKL